MGQIADMEGTRLRILQLLQKNGRDTVDGLAHSIGLAPATIRRHLDILQRDRLVAFEEVRKRTGRPEYSFFLTNEGQEALPKDYDQLLTLVIQEVAALTTEDTRDRNGEQVLGLVFQRLSRRVSDRYEGQLAGKDMEHRLSILVQVLKEQDFFPEAEVVEGTLRIRLLNCPFRSVALQNNSVCAFDSNLISTMLDLRLTQEACIHNGDSGCIYKAHAFAREPTAPSASLERVT